MISYVSYFDEEKKRLVLQLQVCKKIVEFGDALGFVRHYFDPQGVCPAMLKDRGRRCTGSCVSYLQIMLKNSFAKTVARSIEFCGTPTGEVKVLVFAE